LRAKEEIAKMEDEMIIEELKITGRLK